MRSARYALCSSLLKLARVCRYFAHVFYDKEREDCELEAQLERKGQRLYSQFLSSLADAEGAGGRDAKRARLVDKGSDNSMLCSIGALDTQAGAAEQGAAIAAGGSHGGDAAVCPDTDSGEDHGCDAGSGLADAQAAALSDVEED